MNKKIFCILLYLFVFFIPGKAQTDSVFLDSLRNYELKLQGLAEFIVQSNDSCIRRTSCYYFSNMLAHALRIPGSYNYPFDSLKNISRIESPDKRFRFFTWTLRHDPDSFQYFGCIQMNAKESFAFFGLYDSSSSYPKNPIYKVLDQKHWYGALYYQIVPTKYKRNTYYSLIGWDGHDRTSSRKVIDVLTFDDKGKPKFGAPLFKLYKNRRPQTRVIFEFQDDAVMALRYEKKKNIIVFENLVPPDTMLTNQFETYLPDGTYDYFKFKRGYWIKNEMLFDTLRNATEEE